MVKAVKVYLKCVLLQFFENFKEKVMLFTDIGKLFHKYGAEEENELSCIACFDLGTARKPLVVNLNVSVRWCDCDIGVKRFN